MKRKITLILAVILTAWLAVGCSSKRWKHVNIHQVNGAGEIVQTWEDVKIIATKIDFLSGGDNWTRFETKDGKQWTLFLPHNYEYR